MELGSIGQGTWAIAEGQPETPQQANSNPIVNYQSATPEYFAAMGIPLLRGRMFSDEDRAPSPRVALISESTAAAFFPGQNPVGKRVKAASFNANNPTIEGVWRTVIGVVGNVRYKGLHEVQLDLYDPPSQTTVGTTTSLVVRLKPGEEDKALAVAAAIQTQARQSDPRALVSGIMMLDEVVNKEIAPWRFSAWVFALFAGLAFALAMLGLFSLVSLDVANRRREFAIRMAVGATGGHLVGGVFGGGRGYQESAEPALRRPARRRVDLRRRGGAGHDGGRRRLVSAGPTRRIHRPARITPSRVTRP
jgi:putative ABC transport system permease protein